MDAADRFGAAVSKHGSRDNRTVSGATPVPPPLLSKRTHSQYTFSFFGPSDSCVPAVFGSEVALAEPLPGKMPLIVL